MKRDSRRFIAPLCGCLLASPRSAACLRRFFTGLENAVLNFTYPAGFYVITIEQFTFYCYCVRLTMNEQIRPTQLTVISSQIQVTCILEKS